MFLFIFKIQVDPESFVITIMENENLQKLFPKNVTVGGGKGKAFIHYNQKLCMEEINNFIAASTLAPPQDFEVRMGWDGMGWDGMGWGNKSIMRTDK